MIYISPKISDFSDSEMKILYDRLPEFRKIKADRLSDSLKAKQSIVAYHLLTDAVKKERNLDILDEDLKSLGTADFAYTQEGKPYFKNHPDIFFNLSHSGDYAVCALSGNEVGIDIQKISKYHKKIADFICSEAEISFVEGSQNPNLAFTTIWSLKEAYKKAQGTFPSSRSFKTVDFSGFLKNNSLFNDIGLLNDIFNASPDYPSSCTSFWADFPIFSSKLEETGQSAQLFFSFTTINSRTQKNMHENPIPDNTDIFFSDFSEIFHRIIGDSNTYHPKTEVEDKKIGAATSQNSLADYGKNDDHGKDNGRDDDCYVISVCSKISK